MDNEYMDNEYNEKTIVTLAIITHGGVIQFDLHQNMQSLFQYVRLFSKAGDFKATCTTPSEDNTQLTLLYSYLRKNLNKETFLALEDYEKKVGGKMIEHITFDKIFRVDESTNVEGIFLVSIHRKKTLDNYELIWPKDSKYTLNINLLDFHNLTRFIQIVHPSTTPDVDMLVNELSMNKRYDNSHHLRTGMSYETKRHMQALQEIEKGTFTEKEKMKMVEGENARYLQYLQEEFRLEIDEDNSEIMSIRLSVLVELIQKIVGEDCGINIVDYSCNNIMPFVSSHEKSYASYVKTSDIENPPPYMKKWGGIRKQKRMTNKRNTSKTKTRNKNNKKKKKKKTKKNLFL